MTRRLILLPLLSLALCACDTWTDEESQDSVFNFQDSPVVPPPSVQLDAPVQPLESDERQRLYKLPIHRKSVEARQSFRDLLEHPWILKQPGVTTLTRVMAEDILLLNQAHAQLTQQRAAAGLETPSLEEETAMIVSSLENLQEPLKRLQFDWPIDLYNVLNIPPSHQHQTPPPVPYQVHKRLHLYTSSNGFPSHLDVRVFSLIGLGGIEAQEATVLAIVNWHLNTLVGGELQFTRYVSTDCVAFVGNGDHNTDHLNPTHGFATKGRTLFVGFLQSQDRLYVLHADGLQEDLEPRIPLLLDILNRPFTRVNRTENPKSDTL